MKKSNIMAHLVLVAFVLVLFAPIHLSNYQAIAQQSNKTKITNTDTTTNNNTTFLAIGTISSLIITVPESGFNITDAFKVILTGEWNLSVHNGTVTDFAANFLASPMDGSRGHIHQITNFKVNDDNKNNDDDNNTKVIQLTPDKNLSVNGTTNVKINGVNVWNNVNASIVISKGSTITIDLDDNQTDNHFGKQQIYGVVNRLIL